jgi:hypothetical protein
MNNTIYLCTSVYERRELKGLELSGGLLVSSLPLGQRSKHVPSNQRYIYILSICYILTASNVLASMLLLAVLAVCLLCGAAST